ncbi:uncharacterized protein LOC135334483 isoform X2 [Halichondria panicea]|uniref:uncharacterized protein LOC135334483 isoform X2 n=1 Tax=Halichondria panicea TaxID=6063 RepID=UPI00312BB57E
MATRPDPQNPIAVKVHPINVGQGDAILLEIQYDKGSPKKWLIDGGRGQKSTFSNLTTALDENDCISKAPISPSSRGKLTWKDRTYRQITLDSIVNTHPDVDHHGGINALLGTGSKQIKSGEQFTACCPIITTSATSLYVEVPDEKNEYKNGVEYSGAESDSPKFWFQTNALGRKHLGLEDLPRRSTVEVCKRPSFRKNIDWNATSILTTVRIPGSTYKYDVVLTGDSYGGIILDTLELKSEKDKPRKTVGVFQVPHHGSKKNSTMARTKGEGSHLSCYTFYMEFDADIYLISHGDNKAYNHPDSEVITGILAAAVKKEQHCKIVVTATRFDGTKINEDTNIGNWRDYVDIYYFSPYVTLDPNDVKRPEGLQLYNKKVPAPSLEAKLAKNNLQREVIIDHDGNGNSFFNAVSQALAHKTNYTPTELRKMLVEHLKTNPKLYYPRSGATTTEEYNKLCSLDDSLSSNIEKILPEAMAQTLRMQIKVIPVNHEQEDKFYGTEPVVQLIHAIDHYDYVLPITSPGDTTDASSPGTTETPLKSSESLVSAKGRRKLVLDTDTSNKTQRDEFECPKCKEKIDQRGKRRQITPIAGLSNKETEGSIVPSLWTSCSWPQQKTTNTSEASPETPPKSSEHPPPLANKSRRELFFTVYKTRVPPTDVVSGTSGGESQPSTFAIQSTMSARISEVNSKKRKWVQRSETENGEENRRPFKKLEKEKCPSSRVCREKVSKTTGGYTCKSHHWSLRTPQC